MRIDFADAWLLGPGMADGLERGPPSESLEVLGEVVGGDEGQDMSLRGLEVRVVESLGGGVFDGSVHPLGLPVGPRMVGLGQPMLDVMLAADTVEDVASKAGLYGGLAATVLRQVGEGHAIVGEHGMNGIGEGLDDLPQEGGAVQLRIGIEGSGHCPECRRPATWVNLGSGHCPEPVDGQEHEELALGQAQFADVDVDIADGGFGEALAL